MKETPVLFSTEMVKAILAGAKTQTRRVIKPQPSSIYHSPIPQRLANGELIWTFIKPNQGTLPCIITCPYGQVGDRLWVRETFWIQSWLDKPLTELQPLHYTADGNTKCLEDYTQKPSIHMPRWASRITLEITEVRVERVQEIISWDCIYEGIAQKYNSGRYFELYGMATDKSNHILIEEYQELWDSLNAKRGFDWDSNPWVWVISFKEVKGES